MIMTQQVHIHHIAVTAASCGALHNNPCSQLHTHGQGLGEKPYVPAWFLNHFSGGTEWRKSEDHFTDALEKAVQEAKYHKRWRKEYMTLLEHYEQEREEGREEGFKKGREEGLKEGRKEAEQEIQKLKAQLAALQQAAKTN